jgi:hypothetical protein
MTRAWSILRRWVWEPLQALCLGLLLVAVLRRGWWCEKGGGLTLLGIGHSELYKAVVEELTIWCFPTLGIIGSYFPDCDCAMTDGALSDNCLRPLAC